MTYIDYLNDFNQWLETNPLPASSQLMYFKLLNIFNRAGWPEEVGVDNLRLQMMLDGAAKTTVVRARDKLVEAGFIVYKKGRKGFPNRYALIRKVSIFATENATVSATENATVYATINATHIKTKTKTKNYDDEDIRAREDEGLGRVMTEYMERIEPTPSPTSVSMLTHYVKTLGPDVCLRAIYRAIDTGVRKWTYIRVILQNCEKDGIKCLADWDKLEEKRNARKPDKQDAPGSSSADERWHLKSHTL